MENRQARHTGDIIKERDNIFQGRTQLALNRRAEGLTARAGDTNRRTIRLQKFLRLLLVVAVWVPLTIGRLVKGGVRDVLGAELFDSSSHTAFFGVHQASGDGQAISGNSERLDLLIDPLCSAARLHAGLVEVGYQSAIARGALDHLATALIFTESDGRVAQTNDAAERVLRLGDGLTIQNGQLCARRSFEAAKLARLIAAAASASAPAAGCMLVGRDAGHLPYVVRVAPIGAEAAASDRPMAMVLITGLDENCASEHELTQLYGLSPAESRLAVALARGKKLSNIAREIGVQITTLRTQVSAILRKFDVERQSDIVRVVFNIPAGPPTDGSTPN